MEDRNAPAARKALRIMGRASLWLAPLGIAIGWALNYASLGDFLAFDFSSPYTDSGQSSSAEQFLATVTAPDGGFRFLLLPHYFVYAAMPLFLAAALYLTHILFRKAPWHAVIGATLTSIGAIYFVGVLGAWLAFPSIATVPHDQAADLLPMVQALTTVRGVLMVSTALSILVFIGMIVFGFALYQSRIVPRWSAILVITGNLLILAFAGTENWMTLGALLMMTGLLPLTRTKNSTSRT